MMEVIRTGQVLRYLDANLAFLLRYVEAQLPSITATRPEGTYLAWLDCREARIPGNPHEFFLDQARVALNDGAVFCEGGEGFVRLNFGCPRATLTEALERMRAAMGRISESAEQRISKSANQQIGNQP